MESYVRIPEFLKPGEVAEFLRLVRGCAHLLTETEGKGGLGPRYKVLDGTQVVTNIPAVAKYELECVRPAAERIIGERLRLLSSPKRAMRIQVYDRHHHSFRWHYDAHSYVALLALINTNRGQTQWISPPLSRILRYLVYPFYAFPGIFSAAPYESITLEAGELLLMRGSRLLHRGVTQDVEGERILIVYCYDETTKKANPLRDWVARKLNY